MIARKLLAIGMALAMLSTGAVRAQEAAPSDMLLATLWTQRSVEYRANALTVFALARIRLDEALADKGWTAAPVEQKGDFASLPPAIILDVDETILDNSLYQAWMMKANQTFSTKTWNQFCAAQISRAIPGAVEFTRYADSKGVKVFYITWGKQWLMLPNPTYGSFDTATYGHDFKKTVAEQRKAKWDVIESWVGPNQ